ncbi:MAG: hypothetical protein ACI4QI_03575, partial [Candidatus Coproplasma sp.]
SGWYLTSDFNSGSKLESGKVGDLGDLCDGVINVSLYALWNTYVELFGSGTQDSPYLIYNLVQLKDLAVKVNNGNNYSGVYFKLVNDITGVGEWTPIGNNNNSTYYSTATAAQNRRFAGIFDGDGHTISGYTITASNQTYTDTYVGLFGYIAAGGVVQNLRVAPVKIDGKSTRSTGSKGGGHYGAIAGINSGSIINCTVVSGEVSGQATLDTHVGGIVGYMFINGARVEGCTVESGVSVTGAAGRCVSHGGIVGSVNNGIIYSCTNKASVSGTNSKSSAYDNGVKGYTFLGGIAGVSCAVLINCTNSGSVSGTTGWSYNSVENAGSGSVVGYLHNGSDANTSSTGDSTLTIDKGNGYTLNGVCYYSAVINCGTGQVIGFLQNDSGNGKITIAVTSNTVYKAISGSSPATVSASGVSTYLESVGVANAFEGGLLVVPLNCVVVNEDIEFVVDDEYTFDITDLPAEAYNYIALVAVGIALIICATVVVTVLLVRRKKRKNTILENTNEIQD